MGRYSGKTCRLIFMLVLTTGFFVAELVSGYLGNSIALISDSFNMLSDLISLCVGISTGFIARRHTRDARATYGYKRAEVVGALSNAVFLTALCFTIFVEAILRLARPERIDDPRLVLIVGALGLAVNVVGLLIFQDCSSCFTCCGRRRRRLSSSKRDLSPPLDSVSAQQQPPSVPPTVVPGSDSTLTLRVASSPRKEEKASALQPSEAGDSVNTQNEPQESTRKKEKKSEALNIRGVLLHVMGDALGSVVVVIAAIIFYVLPLEETAPCNWQCYIDPSLTIIMVIIILSSAFPLIKETAFILLQMVPKGINLEELVGKLSNVPGVSSIHEVHIWELVSGKNIATLHIKCQKSKDYKDAHLKMREIFHNAGIHNVTIQPEYVDQKESLEQDWTRLCNSPCISKTCSDQLCCPPEMQSLTHINGCTEPNGCPPTATYRSDGLSRNDTTAIVIEADRLSDRGPAAKQTQGDLIFVNSTHF
ncbi:calcium/manganese antiporter SLC30A10 isoform X1 [Petaurus breviceps papuanus]|uniref:calcium/manganese antiporter SLC30A10 isoform X1 n=1 Tax=Petaurus breviceps papuanus TaxID=3040969 RepID=UPI0036DE1FE5